ncbi:MAG: transcription antitermination factor NusB [Chloroflexi bacterium]|nr:MAG: transcription antitermination factor NusB [Chloroflexota bacterium]
MGKRHQARELALKVLFQLEGTDDDPEEVVLYHASENGAGEDVTNFARQLVDGVIANRDRLDAIMSEASEHWKLDQMAKVDRIILRIAVYEIAIDRKVPTKAAINESIELAKTFSGDDSGNDLLAELEATMGKLAEGTSPLDELVAAHQRAVRLLADAQSRLANLKARAEQTARLLAE